MMKSSKFVAFMLLGCITVASLAGCGAKNGSVSGSSSGSKGLLGGSSKKELMVDYYGDGNSVNLLGDVSDTFGQLAKQGKNVYLCRLDDGSGRAIKIGENGKLPSLDPEKGYFDADRVKIFDADNDDNYIRAGYLVRMPSLIRAGRELTAEQMNDNSVKFAGIAYAEIRNNGQKRMETASVNNAKLFPELKIEKSIDGKRDVYIDGVQIAKSDEGLEIEEDFYVKRGLFIGSGLAAVYFDDKRVNTSDYLEEARANYQTYAERWKKRDNNLDYARWTLPAYMGNGSDLEVAVAYLIAQDGYEKLLSGEIKQMTFVDMWADVDDSGNTVCGIYNADIYRKYEKDLTVGLYGSDKSTDNYFKTYK